MSEVKKIAIVGPESTGKSTLAEQLAHALQTTWVPEYAREFLESLNRPYSQEDLIAIARGQLESEKESIPKANRYLICDTNLLVIQIWSEYKYGKLLSELEELTDLKAYDFHFLTSTDLPWTFDPLRENPSLREREEIFGLYKDKLDKANVTYAILKGNEKERLSLAMSMLATI